MAQKTVKLTEVSRATGNLINENTIKNKKQKAVNIPNNSWDDVNNLSQLCGQLLLRATGLSPALNNPLLMAQVNDVQALHQSAHILARDLKNFSDEILTLRKRHLGKTGNATTIDENMEAIDIYMAYAMLTERFEANVKPMIMHMTEIIGMAEAKLRDIDNDAADEIGKQVSDQLTTVKSLNESNASDANLSTTVITNIEPKPSIN